MTIRQAVNADIPRLVEIFNEARDIMRSDGNLHQWPDSYPSVEALESDIAQDAGYVIEDNGKAEGYFAFIHGIDTTYVNIYEGEWVDDTLPYAVIHRLAGTKSSHGIASYCFKWCWERVHNLRIDTHRDNRIMQHCILKAGFRYCGIIHLANGEERMAYQKISSALYCE